jgi:hypothetical protein
MKQFENDYKGYLLALDLLRQNDKNTNGSQEDVVAAANALLTASPGGPTRVEPENAPFEPGSIPGRGFITEKKPAAKKAR